MNNIHLLKDLKIFTYKPIKEEIDLNEYSFDLIKSGFKFNKNCLRMENIYITMENVKNLYFQSLINIDFSRNNELYTINIKFYEDDDNYLFTRNGIKNLYYKLLEEVENYENYNINPNNIKKIELRK